MTTLDTGAHPGIDQTAEHVGQNLGRLIRVLDRLRQHADTAATVVLDELVERGPRRVGEIAAALGSDPSTVSRKVAALVDAGLVQRRADPADGRAHLLAATEAGQQRWAAGRHHRTMSFAAVLAGWSEDSRRQLAALLGRLAGELQEKDRRLGRGPRGEI